VSAVLPGTAVIIRARHPLEGRKLRVLGGMRRHGRLELLLVLPDGSKSLVPAAWTDADGAGGAADRDAGQAEAATLGMLGDLLAASVLVSALSARGHDDREQAARKPPTKEDNRAACAAQSAAGEGSGATCDADSPAPAGGRRRSGLAASWADRPGSGPRRGDGHGRGERR
jgi:hypothetical protein